MAMILDAFVGEFVKRLADFLEEEVSTVLGVKGELKSLQNTLENIEAVLQEAERRRIQDKTVKKWLNDLKDVMYDADDILDLCRYKGGSLLQDDPSSSSASPVCCYPPLLSCFTSPSIPFRREIGRSIKDLNVRLEKIHKDKEMFNFSQEPSKPDDMIRRLGGVNLRQTSPVEEDGAVGSDIKEATDRLVKMIVGEEEQKCRVFAIVGMGGIGKTTLAQKVFNEPRIQSSFQEQRRVWVCISQSFSEIDLLKEIIRRVGGHYGDAQTKAELIPIFMKQVTGTRLFLVLDDVWAADVWVDLLRIPLQRELASCSILVTTRKEEVARRMGAVDVHRVEKLSVESGWEMLCKRVFINGEEEETIQSLKHIGIQIVEKCDGLPLAIKTMAGVLSGKERTSGEWEKVVRSDAWSMSELPEGVGEALYLSYDDLPSHLKQCFLYLSLFPEDYHYDVKEELVPLWIAEGLVEPHGRNSLEDTAEEYYKELIRRSLLHPVTDYYSDIYPLLHPVTGYYSDIYPQYFNHQLYCQMHDLLRSLACFLSGNECFCGNVKSISNSITSQARRLYIENSNDDEVLTTESIFRSKHLRTLLLPNAYCSPIIENGLISISRLGGLRVLRLNGDWIKEVPDSIGDLIHLRYLNLDYTSVSTLPESLGRLTNLQFLSLSGCWQFHCLPNCIGDLIHMRCLLINDSVVSELPDSLARLTNLRQLRMGGTPLTHVPKGIIGKLRQLNYLSGVVMGSDNDGKQGCNPEDLQELSQLRILDIRRLERASTGMLELQRKSYLTELVLGFSQQIDGDGQQPYIKTEKMLNELVPPACLESLALDGGFGRSYPSWMSTSLLGTTLPRLSHINLQGFKSCPHVPPLGELPQLKSITIRNFTEVVTIGPEFMGAGVREGINEFPKLETLEFDGMDNWKEWSLDGKTRERERADAGEDRKENRSLILFPLLKRLGIKYCPILRALPISGLPALKSLTIWECPALEDVGSHNALQMLDLSVDEKMECLPEWLIKLLQQRLQAEDSNFKLILQGHVGLLSKCLMDGPYWPIIQQIPQVEVCSLPAGGFKYIRYTKVPFSYTTNFSSGSQDPTV